MPLPAANMAPRHRRMNAPRPRIVGGAEVSPYFNFSFVVGILETAYMPNWFNSQICGGSWIAPQYVLTAAHCINPTKPANWYSVLLHAHDLSGTVQHRCTQVIGVSQYFRHGNYNVVEDVNDVAVLRLSAVPYCGHELRVAGALARLDAPPHSIAQPGLIATVAGWGSLHDGGGLGAHGGEGLDELHRPPKLDRLVKGRGAQRTQEVRRPLQPVEPVAARAGRLARQPASRLANHSTHG